MVNEINRKAQVTIWVIVAIAIVSIIGLLYYFVIGPSLVGGEETNLQSYIGKCMKDSGEEAIDLMLPHGGFVDVKDNYMLYNDEKIEYLCYNQGNYAPCINQHPAYLTELKEEIRNYVQPRVEKCFDDAKKDLESRGYSTRDDLKTDLNVEIVPGSVVVQVNRKITLEKGETTNSYDSFETRISSPLYELANVALVIVGEEAKRCYFEYLGYMLTYPQWDIRFDRSSDLSKIYLVKDKKTEKELAIAIRGCTTPLGI